MGSSLVKPAPPPPPPPLPQISDITNMLSSDKKPSLEKIAMNVASGNNDEAALDALKLIVSDPKKYNIFSFFDTIKGTLLPGRSFGRRIRKRSTRKKQNNRRSKKLKK